MSRTPSAIDNLADEFTLASCELDPILATYSGVPGFDHLVPDYSPDGIAARTELIADTLKRIDATTPQDGTDHVTIAAMKDRLGVDLEIANEHCCDLNNIASPVQSLRDIFDIMPTETTEHWETIAGRLKGLPKAIEGYIESLRQGPGLGLAPTARQITTAAAQARETANPESSFFVTFARKGAEQVPAALAADLTSAAGEAVAAYDRLAQFLTSELGAQAVTRDGVGRERYGVFSRYFVGAKVDLDETYEWGLEELEHIGREQDEIARKIAGEGASSADAVAYLDRDPRRILHGTKALQEWMQETSDHALEQLGATQFDIPAQLRTLECCIAPTQSGGIYYTGPSDDFTRPGRMWWSVPAGVTEFNSWREKTTVYHEGVPGHHLQIGTAVLMKDSLNSWRRLMCWNSGYGEGWALYAERLMAELGFLDDLGDYFGMLDSQRLRAARVVIDMGVHLGKPAPAKWGGGTWDAEKAWTLLRNTVNMEEAHLRFELNRYLTWPGQAPSYKIGQRLWEQMRAKAGAMAAIRDREFSLRQFHSDTLALGALPLDVLSDVVTF